MQRQYQLPPITSDGQAVYTGMYAAWRSIDGNEYVGRVRAYDAWGNLQVIIQSPHPIRGHEIQTRAVRFSHDGYNVPFERTA